MSQANGRNRPDPSSDERIGWTVVAALSKNGVIGRGNALPWKIRSDLRNFKEKTMGHCLLMGRKTFQSIGKPLPGRQTIVLSRQSRVSPLEFPGVQMASSLVEVEKLVEPGRQIMVVGGAEIYRAAMPRCELMFITRVDANVDGDTYFPDIDWSEWEMEDSKPVPRDPMDEFRTGFEVWRRKQIHE